MGSCPNMASSFFPRSGVTYTYWACDTAAEMGNGRGESHIKHVMRGGSTCVPNAASSFGSDIGFISILHHLASQLEAVSTSIAF